MMVGSTMSDTFKCSIVRVDAEELRSLVPAAPRRVVALRHGTDRVENEGASGLRADKRRTTLASFMAFVGLLVIMTLIFFLTEGVEEFVQVLGASPAVAVVLTACFFVVLGLVLLKTTGDAKDLRSGGLTWGTPLRQLRDDRWELETESRFGCNTLIVKVREPPLVDANGRIALLHRVGSNKATALNIEMLKRRMALSSEQLQALDVLQRADDPG